MEENTAQITATELWQPSVQLRWFEKKSEYTSGFKTEKILQQLHTSNLGNRQWMEVPTISE